MVKLGDPVCRTNCHPRQTPRLVGAVLKRYDSKRAEVDKVRLDLLVKDGDLLGAEVDRHVAVLIIGVLGQLVERPCSYADHESTVLEEYVLSHDAVEVKLLIRIDPLGQGYLKGAVLPLRLKYLYSSLESYLALLDEGDIEVKHPFIPLQDDALAIAVLDDGAGLRGGPCGDAQGVGLTITCGGLLGCVD